jgi:hypothetical protein
MTYPVDVLRRWHEAINYRIVLTSTARRDDGRGSHE